MQIKVNGNTMQLSQQAFDLFTSSDQELGDYLMDLVSRHEYVETNDNATEIGHEFRQFLFTDPEELIVKNDSSVDSRVIHGAFSCSHPYTMHEVGGKCTAEGCACPADWQVAMMACGD